MTGKFFGVGKFQYSCPAKLHIGLSNCSVLNTGPTHLALIHNEQNCSLQVSDSVYPMGIEFLVINPT